MRQRGGGTEEQMANPAGSARGVSDLPPFLRARIPDRIVFILREGKRDGRERIGIFEDHEVSGVAPARVRLPGLDAAAAPARGALAARLDRAEREGAVAAPFGSQMGIDELI